MAAQQLINGSFNRVPKSVGIWLCVGVFMVVMQVSIGGITRLTNSGLSITEWNLIGGVIPPLNTAQWTEAFDKYKAHTIQASLIHADMTLSEFKFIFFWEWFHRLFARSLGFVFVIPFIIFWRRGYFNAVFKRQLFTLVALGGVVGLFGWIMVKSGLDTPEFAWVNAYKLTLHLSLALVVFSYLLWMVFQVWQPYTETSADTKLRKLVRIIAVFAVLQIMLGGVMSGMKAGLPYHYFPVMESTSQQSLTLDGNYIPKALSDGSLWSMNSFVHYQQNTFASGFINFCHRSTAYILSILVLVYFFLSRKRKQPLAFRKSAGIMVGALGVQVFLGIYTLINCIGAVPAVPGVLHQLGAIVFLSTVLYANYQYSKGGEKLIPSQV